MFRRSSVSVQGATGFASAAQGLTYQTDTDEASGTQELNVMEFQYAATLAPLFVADILACRCISENPASAESEQQKGIAEGDQWYSLSSIPLAHKPGVGICSHAERYHGRPVASVTVF